jgi:uncharacterized membrane protein YhhN
VTLALVVFTGACVVALLVAESRGPEWLRFASKLLASTGFLALALSCGALASGHGRIVLVALVLCWAGDALLLPRGAGHAFLAGLGSFLLGHVAFGLGFTLLGLEPIATAVAGVLVGAGGFAAWRWLDPHVTGRMRGPVIAYVLVISAMVVLSIGASVHTGDARLGVGAAAFMASDLSVARERFVAPGAGNKEWGLPLYYAATTLLATTV